MNLPWVSRKVYDYQERFWQELNERQHGTVALLAAQNERFVSEILRLTEENRRLRVPYVGERKRWDDQREGGAPATFDFCGPTCSVTVLMRGPDGRQYRREWQMDTTVDPPNYESIENQAGLEAKNMVRRLVEDFSLIKSLDLKI